MLFKTAFFVFSTDESNFLIYEKNFHQISLLFVVDKKEMSTPRIVSEKENTTSKK